MSAAREVHVKLVVDTTQIQAAMARASEATALAAAKLERFRTTAHVMGVHLELLPMTPEQAWARFYVRGAMDHRYESPDQVDRYIRILLRVPGPVAAAARDAFLRGWAEHRSGDRTPEQVWHRFIGDTIVQVRTGGAL